MNRRSFLSFLAGLPVIGKYWKPPSRPVVPIPDITVRYAFRNSKTGVETATCADMLYNRPGKPIQWYRYDFDGPHGPAATEKAIREALDRRDGKTY